MKDVNKKNDFKLPYLYQIWFAEFLKTGIQDSVFWISVDVLLNFYLTGLLDFFTNILLTFCLTGLQITFY